MASLAKKCAAEPARGRDVRGDLDEDVGVNAKELLRRNGQQAYGIGLAGFQPIADEDREVPFCRHEQS